MALRDTLKVLVVDDMSTSRGIILQALDALGICNVESAENGTGGMQRACRGTLDLILSDLYMPEMNGLQLLQQIRHDPKTRGIGFILVTGRSDPTILAAGRKLGMNNFLKKPFSSEEMKVSVEAVVGRL